MTNLSIISTQTMLAEFISSFFLALFGAAAAWFQQSFRLNIPLLMRQQSVEVSFEETSTVTSPLPEVRKSPDELLSYPPELLSDRELARAIKIANHQHELAVISLKLENDLENDPAMIELLQLQRYFHLLSMSTEYSY